MILGAGVIGLTLASELRARGHRVGVAETRTPLAQASTAAAGMLAVEDPYNPSELRPLSRLSGSLYPSFLLVVKERSGLPVPWQTQVTRQTTTDGAVVSLDERSIDPRQLAPALLGAVRSQAIPVMAAVPGRGVGALVHTTGAWGLGGLPVSPRKGQMLRVKVPSGTALEEVHRSEHVYVVPRTRGPQRGTALIGATVEDAGFDLTTSPEALAELRRVGARLVPELGSAVEAPALEAWAGLRPSTPDGLPLLGRLTPEDTRGDGALRLPGVPQFVATGHFRNGILLAPATAVVMADLIEGREPSVSIAPYDPLRFRHNRQGGLAVAQDVRYSSKGP